MSARGFIGAGDLYVSRFNPATNSFLPFVGPIETTKFEITPKTELKEMVSKSRDGYGQVVETVALAQPFEFAVDFAEVSGDTLVTAFLGTKTAINVAGGAFADLPVTAAVGAWADIGRMNVVPAGLAVRNEAGTTTYALGTDYEINYRLGTIRALAGGAITNGQVLEVSGTSAAFTGTQIEGGTQAQIRAKFRFDGKNQVDGLPVIVDVYEAVIAADSAFDFLADDFAAVSLPGKLKTPAGMSAPFVVKMLDNAI
ncbi:MAG: hypothetical protein Q8K24_05920 [Hydrogenophaga sp.]|nr:hypothetical protein [Hydrogenophaga sp.]